MSGNSEVVERVARALCRRHFAAFSTVSAPDPMDEETYWRGWAGEARAAIEALLEPTDAMCHATGDGPATSRRVWQAMLSEALSPSLKEQEEGN